MNLDVKGIPHESTAEQLAENLRQAILDGQLAPGTRLVEQELAEQFDISRGPIREAIRILASEGLAELRKNKGAVVVSPTMDDVLEVYAIRMTLGAIAIDQLARQAAHDQLDLSKVTELLDLMSDRKIRQSNMQMVETDLRFQNELVALSELPRITAAMEKSSLDIRIFVRALNIEYDEVDHTNLVERHTNLLAKIIKGEAETATSLWFDHVRKSVAEFTKDMSSSDLNEFFERPLMRHVFDEATKEATK